MSWKAVWSPDGDRLAVAGVFVTPRVLRVWSSTEDLIDYAFDCCVRRELTAQEREELGLQPAQDDRHVLTWEGDRSQPDHLMTRPSWSSISSLAVRNWSR